MLYLSLNEMFPFTEATFKQTKCFMSQVSDKQYVNIMNVFKF